MNTKIMYFIRRRNTGQCWGKSASWTKDPKMYARKSHAIHAIECHKNFGMRQCEIEIVEVEVTEKSIDLIGKVGKPFLTNAGITIK